MQQIQSKQSAANSEYSPPCFPLYYFSLQVQQSAANLDSGFNTCDSGFYTCDSGFNTCDFKQAIMLLSCVLVVLSCDAASDSIDCSAGTNAIAMFF